MEPAGANGAMFAEIMQVLERLWMIHVLRWVESRTFLTTLRRLAIVLDGRVMGRPPVSEGAIGDEGYLALEGLVPMPAAERAKMRKEVTDAVNRVAK